MLRISCLQPTYCRLCDACCRPACAAGRHSVRLSRGFRHDCEVNGVEPAQAANSAGCSRLSVRHVARAAPDGYTLLFTSIPHVINPHLYRKVNYDAVRDFDAVIQFVAVPLMLASNTGFPAKSVRELVALAKTKPGQINYASAGAGSSSHLAMELFRSMTGIDMTHIPYKGTGPLMTD